MKIELFSDRAIGGEVTSDGDFLLFENNRYTRKGFLFKSFVMSAIVSTNYLNQLHRWFSLFFFFVGMNSIDTYTYNLWQIAEGVKPTLAELEKFEDTPEGAEVECMYSLRDKWNKL